MKSQHTHATISIAVLLIVILLFKVKLNIILKYLFTGILMFIIIYMITKNISFSLILSTVICIILIFMDRNNQMTYEKFENDTDIDSNKKKIEADAGLNQILDILDEGISLGENDKNEHTEIQGEQFNNNHDDNNTGGKKIEEYSPQQAQKETFKLIDTVKQLKHTIDALGPALSAGKDILKSFEALKV